MSFLDDYELMPDDPVVLHAICTDRSHSHIAQLVADGADVDQPNGWGNTPLHYACEIGDLALVKLLLSLDAKPNPTNREGYTPLGRVLASDATICAVLASAGGKLQPLVPACATIVQTQGHGFVADDFFSDSRCSL